MTRQHASRSPSAAPTFDTASGEMARRAAVTNVTSGLKSYVPSAALRDGGRETPAAHDFSAVPATRAEASPAAASARDRTRGNVAAPTDQNAKGISGSGSGTVATTYTPEANDKSTKIVFIQVMRELLDSVPALPSESDASFAYQDTDTTSDFHHVDYVSGEKDPYYNGDDASDFGPQGNALTKTPASTTDTPHFPDGSFPVGKSTILYEFRTAAFSAAGADAGTYYGYSDWTYSKEKGKPEATATTGTGTGEPGSKFTTAVDLFNANHGFKMPGTGGLGAGAIAGIVLGSIVGAAALGVGIAALAGAFN